MLGHCIVPDCRCVFETPHIFCYFHWHSLPLSLQKALMEEGEKYENSTGESACQWGFILQKAVCHIANYRNN